ncbi:hypothetical protein JRQ81_009111 [Phrynocephalus forsythii]|uniref:Autophagy related 2A n=1 Tax=Phrynocephalus forsythii TaxID=171643 RepID=A0A9Q1AS81_9SAUR|nr:hypothetical protein JRQ81_009111 [Phrynocephalus forsythii]
MSRWFFPWSSSIKKRACRYLLQHYLGHFLEERLGLEQLSLDLYAGAGRLRRIHLDVWSVNEFLESVGAPLEIIDGFIDSIAVAIPWSALVTENCTVEVSGLQITCRPKYRNAASGSESQSWASCMTTSMQLAQECLKEQAAEEPSDTPQPLEGLEMFAQTIETVLRRIQVTFLDTVIRVEHESSGGQASVALEVHIKRLDYCDEAVKDPKQALPVDIHQPPPFVHKILQLSGLQLYYEDFSEGNGAAPSPVPKEEAELSTCQEKEASPLLQIGSCSGYTEMRIKLKQNEAFPGPKLRLRDQDLLREQNLEKLTGAAVQLSGEHKAAGQLNRLSWEASFGRLEILESLRPVDSRQATPVYTELLAFATPSAFPHGHSPQPCARIRSKHSEKLPSKKSRLVKAVAKQTVELVAELAEFSSDVDLGTLDRLCSLLHFAAPSSSSSSSSSSSPPAWPPHKEHLADSRPAATWQATMHWMAPKATLRLQFPIPDLRPWPERRSWAEKAVRKERLCLDLAGVDFRTELGPSGATWVEASFSDLHGVYEDGEEVSVPCFRVVKTPDLSAKGLGKTYTLPKIRLTLQPLAADAPWESARRKSDEMERSSAESPCELKQPEPSPFSSKRTMYETEEMVIPGDPEEIAEFQAQTLEASQYALEVTFPIVHIFLPSKEFYESIYNRINNDLLMWEPFSPPPSPLEPLGGPGSATSPFASGGPPSVHWRENFQMCKSAFKLDSDSEEEDSHFYSVDETQRKKEEARSPCLQSYVSIMLHVGKGRVTALCDAKGEGGKKLEGSHGELVLDVETGSLFSVSQYKGREDLGYFCLEAEKVSLYHKAVVEDYPTAEHLDIPSFLPPEGLHPTIYASQEGNISWPSGTKTEGAQKMLSLVIQINLDLEKNIKEFLVTLRLEGATMRHYMALAHQSWYSQVRRAAHTPHARRGRPIPGRSMPRGKREKGPLVGWGREAYPGASRWPWTISLMSGRRTPVRSRPKSSQGPSSSPSSLTSWMSWMTPSWGFVPPTIITVLHTHLFSCAVDYRPLYLPVRVLLTAETFTLSSNIIVDTSVFLLRFILDDSALYLSNKCETETGDLRKDYVCVVDVDLLELVITTWKGTTTGKLTRPLFELRCSNNVVHVHTCADSCAALANLIQYVVNNGDLRPPPRHDSPTEIAGQKVQLAESPAPLLSCPPAETAAINQRDLTDALMDTERSLQELASETGDPGFRRQLSPVSVYLFPGENGAAGKGRKVPAPPPASSVAEGLDFSPSEDSEGESEVTDDFCILDAPGTGIPPRDGEPMVTKLLEGPIRIQEGHFARPLGSTDLLKAPLHFPVPESRVMMREISVVWHLYGGRDFGPGRSAAGHSHSPRANPSLPSARSSPSRSSVTNRPQNTWRAQGGTNRIHDLLMEIQLTKMSFQHETYPSGASEKPPADLEEQPLARQVFIVQELEIRDRLASSQINKFLYLYSSEHMPRRTHSNMLTIKALHVCPESALGGPECCLRVSLMPLRLNIDQDALFFLKDFFTSVAANINPVVPVDPSSEGKALAKQSGESSAGKENKRSHSLLSYWVTDFFFLARAGRLSDARVKTVCLG